MQQVHEAVDPLLHLHVDADEVTEAVTFVGKARLESPPRGCRSSRAGATPTRSPTCRRRCINTPKLPQPLSLARKLRAGDIIIGQVGMTKVPVPIQNRHPTVWKWEIWNPGAKARRGLAFAPVYCLLGSRPHGTFPAIN
nr:hypothetical protein Iba_chr11cCG9390 [Ipomoea batatas]